MVEFVVLLGMVLLRVVLLVAAVVLLLRPRTTCPACFERSVPVLSWTLAHLAPWLERRWCPRCGWQGLGRKDRPGG